MRKLFKHVSIPTFMGGVLFPVGSQCVGLRVVARIPGKAEMAYSSRTPTEAEKENCCIPGTHDGLYKPMPHCEKNERQRMSQ